jgi:hypothetical protein
VAPRSALSRNQHGRLVKNPQEGDWGEPMNSGPRRRRFGSVSPSIASCPQWQRNRARTLKAVRPIREKPQDLSDRDPALPPTSTYAHSALQSSKSVIRVDATTVGLRNVPRALKMPMGISHGGIVILDPHWLTKTEGLNGSIALVKSNVLPDDILRILYASFPTQIVTYYNLTKIVSEPYERFPRLLILGMRIANGTFESEIRSLSLLVPRIPTIVLAHKVDVESARKLISLGVKAYIPMPTRCGVVAVIRFILTSAA